MNLGEVADWSNLLRAYKKAAAGKRQRDTVAFFEYQLADRLLEIQTDLQTRTYKPGPYTNFYIHSPKRRKISAAPFRDRVVHHALCNVIEPWFERRFIFDSYANRRRKGTHRAVARLQYFAERFRYVLRLDIVKHFPSIDHQILIDLLFREIQDENLRGLVKTIISSGVGVLDDEYPMTLFPGDDLLDLARPTGLPIGNLSSQFWSNCYLNGFDHYAKRDLHCTGYLRYVDDMAFFSNSKTELWDWKHAVINRLATLRLSVHPRAQLYPTSNGVPWLGFIVYPTHRKVKARKVRDFNRHLTQRWDDFCAGTITFAEFDTSVQGWINHVGFADTWGLRKHVLGRPLRRPSS